MDADTILALAARAANHVRKRYELRWSHEDMEDARQEAAAGIVRALRDVPDKGEGYYFRAGAQAATRYAFRQKSLYADSITTATGDYRGDGGSIESPSRGWATPIEDTDFPRLRKLLSQCPRKDGARGGPKTRDQLAVARDLIILQSLSEGLSQRQIADVLGTSRDHIAGYQSALRRRLAALGARQ